MKTGNEEFVALGAHSLFTFSHYFLAFRQLFLFTVLFKEPGHCLSRDGPVRNDEPPKENGVAAKVPERVLDFSSGSEEDEVEQGFKGRMSNPSAVDGNRGRNAATGASRLSLFQYGFSRLLEGVEGKQELGEGDSSVEESPFEEEIEDQKTEGASSGLCKSSDTGNGAVCLSKMGKKTRDLSSGSDMEEREKRGGGRQEGLSLVKQSKRQGQKGWTNKKITVFEESDEISSPDKKKPNKLNTTIPRVHHFDGYSDESEDLELEAMTGPKRDAFDSNTKVGDEGRGRLDRNRKRKSSSVRDKARNKYTDEIETFTSSEDEHATVKKARPAGCHFTSPQTERSRDELPKDGQRAATTDRAERRAGSSKAVSFTSLKSPASKGKDGTIDSVLGQIQHLHIYMSDFNELNLNSN